MTDPLHARIETMLSAFARDIERAWRMGTDSEAVAKLEKETASRIFSALAESVADGRVEKIREFVRRERVFWTGLGTDRARDRVIFMDALDAILSAQNPPNSSNSSQPAEKADCPECHHAIARAVERAPLHDDGYIAQCEVCGKRHVRKREEPEAPNWSRCPACQQMRRGGSAEHPDTIALRVLKGSYEALCQTIDACFPAGNWGDELNRRARLQLVGKALAEALENAAKSSPTEPPQQTIREQVTMRLGLRPNQLDRQLGALCDVLQEMRGIHG